MAPGKKCFCVSPFLIVVFVVIVLTGSMEDDDDSNFGRRLFETVFIVVALLRKIGLLKPGSIVFVFRLDTSPGGSVDEPPIGKDDEMIVFPFSEFSESSTEGGVFVFLRGAAREGCIAGFLVVPAKGRRTPRPALRMTWLPPPNPRR